MDKVTFFNQALQLIGDRQYKEGTPGYEACNLWFPDVMREALAYGAWSFATVRRELVAEREPGVFLLPEECVNLLRVGARRFEKRGWRIYVDGEPSKVDVWYVSDDLARGEHLPKGAPRFVQGVRELLAARITGKLEGDVGKAVQLERVAWDTLTEALHDDVTQYASNDQHPLEDIMGQSIMI